MLLIPAVVVEAEVKVVVLIKLYMILLLINIFYNSGMIPPENGRIPLVKLTYMIF